MDTIYWLSIICNRFNLEISCIILFNPPNSLTRWLSPLCWESESAQCLMNVTPIASSKEASLLKFCWNKKGYKRMYDYMTELGCEWSILILLPLTTSLSMRKLGLRAGGGPFYLVYSPDALHLTGSLSWCWGYRTFGRVCEIPTTPSSHL